MPSDCPQPARPYHTLLTASSGIYQEWQTRIFHWHYLRMKRADRCGEVGGFTRLLTQPAGTKADGLVGVMKTVVVTELTKGEDLGFVVLNRPHSLVEAFKRGDLDFAERFVLICETDHIFLKPMPNLATETEAVGYPFHYMLPTRNPKTRALVRRFAGSDEAARAVQQVGPSPILMRVDDVRRVAPDWEAVSFALKRDPEADAEFGWMLEMWGYSIACGKAGIRHKILDEMQIEPSSQFGTQITARRAAGAPPLPTHYVYHYTFAHEYSMEGVAQLDSKHGEWSFDKRNVQKYLPLGLIAPPRCALEAAHTLHAALSDAAHAIAASPSEQGGPWHGETPRASDPSLARHASTVRAGVEAMADEPAAAELLGTGPWVWRPLTAAAAGAEADAPFFFLRGGFMSTPWGSARWAATKGLKPAERARLPGAAGGTGGAGGGGAVPQLVVYLCGAEKWTHGIDFGAARPDEPETWSVTITARSTGEQHEAVLDAPRGAAPGHAPQDAADVRSALLAHDTPSPSSAEATADASPLRRRLLGTGPWAMRGMGDLFLLRGGRAYKANGKQVGSWSVRALTLEVDGAAQAAAHGMGVALEGVLELTMPGGSAASVFYVACWRLYRLEHDGATLVAAANDFAWRRPASRCFPTCSEHTHALTKAERDASPLAQQVMGREWSWAGISGMRFKLGDDGGQEGVLVTPWGHGVWGVVPKRADVLFAEFAQQVHMLQFWIAERKFVSTRCSDGELVNGASRGG